LTQTRDGALDEHSIFRHPLCNSQRLGTSPRRQHGLPGEGPGYLVIYTHCGEFLYFYVILFCVFFSSPFLADDAASRESPGLCHLAIQAAVLTGGGDKAVSFPVMS
jgi:hypothetical protein